MAKFRILAVVICDDIRREVSGKDILVGAYSSEIVVGSLPAPMHLAFWLELMSSQSGAFSVFFKLEVPGTVLMSEMRIDIEIVDPALPFAISTPQINMVINQAGKLKVLFKSEQLSKYEVIKTKNIRYQAHPMFQQTENVGMS